MQRMQSAFHSAKTLFVRPSTSSLAVSNNFSTSTARPNYTTKLFEDDKGKDVNQFVHTRRKNAIVGDILVQKLNWTTGNKELKKYMEQFGKVRDVKIQYDQSTGLSRGYGYVTMENMEGLEKALEQIEHNLDNTRILVKSPNPPESAFLNKGRRRRTSIRTSSRQDNY